MLLLLLLVVVVVVVQRVSNGALVERWAAVNLSRVPEGVFREFATNLAAMCNTTGLVRRACILEDSALHACRQP